MNNRDPQAAVFVELFRGAPTKGERTKSRIVEAAVDCIAERGLAGTHFESVGKRVGMARRNVAYHFPALDDLILLCIQYVVSVGQTYAVRKLRTSTHWKKQLELYVSSTFEWLAENPAHGPVLVSLYQLSTFDGRYRELYERISQAGQGRIRALLDGSRGTAAEKDATAAAIYSLMNGNVIKAVCTSAKRSPRSWAADTVAAAAQLVGRA